MRRESEYRTGQKSNGSGDRDGKDRTMPIRQFHRGDYVWIAETGDLLRPVRVLSAYGGIYLVQFSDRGGAIQVKGHRLYATKREAEQAIRIRKPPVDPRLLWY